jgi:hypothetical protein
MPLIPRSSIIDLIAPAFDDGPANKNEILAVALEAEADPRTLGLLQLLPYATFAKLSELWMYLPSPPPADWISHDEP